MDKQKEKHILNLKIGGVPVTWDEWIDQWPALEWGTDFFVPEGHEWYTKEGWNWVQRRRDEMASDILFLEYWGT